MAPDDIWAVGLAAGFGDGAATTVPLAVHWDGSSWTDVDVPRISNRHHELNDVVAISPDDVWAVGDYRNVADVYRGVTYHWDGTEWTHIESPIESHQGVHLVRLLTLAPVLSTMPFPLVSWAETGPAIARTGKSSPLGYYKSGEYCVKNR